MPRLAIVDRPLHACAHPGERVELLDRGVRAVREHRARVEQCAVRVCVLRLAGPEAVGEIAVGRRVRELHRRGHSERREPADVFRREQLRVLDPRAQPERLPRRAGRLERVERVAVRSVTDRVHGDGKTRGSAGADDLCQLVAARDLHARAVEQQRGLRAERTVHEDLQVADAQERAPEARPDAERRELGHVLRGQRLPDAERQRAARLEPLPEPQRTEPAVLVVHGRHPA